MERYFLGITCSPDCPAWNDSDDNVTQILVSSSLKYSFSFSTLSSSVSFLICELNSADLFGIGDIVSSVFSHVSHVNSDDLANMSSIFRSSSLLVAAGRLVLQVVSKSSSCLSSVPRSFAEFKVQSWVFSLWLDVMMVLGSDVVDLTCWSNWLLVTLHRVCTWLIYSPFSAMKFFASSKLSKPRYNGLLIPFPKSCTLFQTPKNIPVCFPLTKA